jgi:hypothetical protein
VEQFDFAKKVVEVLESIGIPYMIVGSYGSGAWGEPRFTQDIDIVASLMPEDAPALARAFPSPEYYLSAEAVTAAATTGGHFNIIHSASSLKADFYVLARGIRSHTQLSRRKQVILPDGVRAYVASPEDIIVGKMEYYREGGSEKHLRDITGILNCRRKELDREYIRGQAESLGLMEIWRAVLERIGEPLP